MAINVERISVIHEKLNFLYCSVGGVVYGLINVSDPFSLVYNYESFTKLNLRTFQVLVRQRVKAP